MQSDTSKTEARSKLKQRMNAERLKRSSGVAQRSFLEKKKVPSDLVDNCLQQMKQNKPLGQMLEQLKKLSENVQDKTQSMNPDALQAMFESVAKSSPERSSELNAMLQNLSELTSKLKNKDETK